MRQDRLAAAARLAHVLQSLALVVLPLAVILTPTRWLERHPIPCVYTTLLGMHCPGCGMTRAVSCAVHGRFRDAWHYNPLIVVMLPLATYEWLRFIRGMTWRA